MTARPPADLAVALHPAVRVLERGHVVVGGSPLRVLRLSEAGYRPVVYDNFSTGHRSFVAGALVVGDIADGQGHARARLRRT